MQTRGVKELKALYLQGAIDKETFEKIYKTLRSPAVWFAWITRTLFLLGTTLILAGVFFFFAFNWASMHRFLKFGLLEGGIILSILVSSIKGVSTVYGRASLLTGIILVGVLLAVYGQVYHSEADSFMIFLLWAGLTLPWIVLTNSTPLWCLWLIILDFATGLFIKQEILTLYSLPHELPWIAVAVLNGLFLYAREALLLKGRNWLNPVWVRPFLLTGVLLPLSVPVLIDAFTEKTELISTVLWILGTTGCFILYRYYLKDLVAVALIIFTTNIVIYLNISRILNKIFGTFCDLFFIAAFIVTISSLSIRWIRKLAGELPSTTYQQSLTALLSDDRLTAEQRGILQKIADRQYNMVQLIITLLQAFSAWLTIIPVTMLLVSFGIINTKKGAFITGMLFFLAAILIYRRKDTVFFNQLSLVLSLVGDSLLVGVIPLILYPDANSSILLLQACLVQSLICIVFYRVIKSSVFRFVTSLSAALLATMWTVVNNSSLTITILVGIEFLLLFLFLIKKDLNPVWNPLIYSSALMLSSTVFFLYLFRAFPDLQQPLNYSPVLWPTNILLTTGVFLFFLKITGGINKDNKYWLLPVLTGLTLLGIFTSSGIIVSLVLLIAGFMHDDRILTFLGYAFLGAFLVLYYYSLELTLMEKAAVLAGSGILLLILRAVIKTSAVRLQQT